MKFPESRKYYWMNKDRVFGGLFITRKSNFWGWLVVTSEEEIKEYTNNSPCSITHALLDLVRMGVAVDSLNELASWKGMG